MNSSKNLSNNSTATGRSFPYPICWQDDARAQVLLAPFRERSVNPENYDSKMKFWMDIIAEYCRFKGSACFCKQEILQTFTRGQRTPSCLDAVLLEMQRLKLIRLRDDYEYDPANTWSGWALNSFLKKPLSWGQTRVKSFFGSPDPHQLGLVEFVHLIVVDNFCNRLQNVLSQPPYSGTIQHFERLKLNVANDLGISEDGLRLCLFSLNSRNKIGLELKRENCNNVIHLVKIPSASDTNVTITEADHALHNLESTKESLAEQLDNLEDSIKETEDKARLYLSENKRSMAKTYLRKKHLLEKNHEKRSLALHNIELLLSNVDEAKHNGLVLEAYKFGSKTLKDVLSASNLSFDNVDEVVTDVRDTLDNCKEIQDTLSNVSLDKTSSQEEDSLEQELRDLMGESLNKKSDNQTNKSGQVETTSLTVEITDSDLLAMLEGLEVEQKTPEKNSTLHSVKSP